jgi:coenzyme Q-binding protein COQ10
MIRVEHSIIIQAPVEQVFSYAADYRKWPEWYEGVSDVTTTTAVTVGNDARYAYRVRVMTVSAVVETEIHDFVQNRGWTGVSTKGIPHRTTWIFEPIGPATRFTHAVEGHMPVPLLGSLFDSMFLEPQWNKIVKNSLNNLKQHFLIQGSGSARQRHDKSA